MKDFKVISFDIHNSLFNILRFDIVLSQMTIKADQRITSDKKEKLLYPNTQSYPEGPRTVEERLSYPPQA